MTRTPTNVPASVSARLLAHSRSSGENHQFLLQRYGAERFLYRLGQSRHRDSFVLKGAMLFALWGGSIYRPTKDLDFTAFGNREPGAVATRIEEICLTEVEADGIEFDRASLEAGPIRNEADYGGVRVTVAVRQDSARFRLQFDLGFGDAITPGPTDADYPVLLDGSPRPRIRVYPQEAVVAEKLHAMVVLGERNSRYKDFYDLFVLASSFGFDGARLASAIAATFERRSTAINAALPAALAPAFYQDPGRASLWRGFRTRNSLTAAPENFEGIFTLLSSFLTPVWSAQALGTAFAGNWPPAGPWDRA